jgi:serine/threonine-protein kinase
MSPEQAQGLRTIDHRTDIWSLGVVMYKALTGRTPFSGVEALGQVILAICSQPPRPVQESAPWVPPEIATIVHRAIRQDPAERFQSATEMFEAVRPLLTMGRALHRPSLSAISVSERSQIAKPLSLINDPRPPFPPAPSAALAESTEGLSSYTHAGVTSPRAGSAGAAGPKIAVAVLGAVVIAIGATAVGVVALRKSPKAHPAAAAHDSAPALPTTPPEKAFDKTAEPASEARTVTVTVTPAKAAVEVDGVRTDPGPNGEIAIAGPLGSRHRVRVSSGKHDNTVDVVIGLDGPTPDKIALTTSPIASATSAKPTAAPAAARPGQPAAAASGSDIKAIRVFE